MKKLFSFFERFYKTPQSGPQLGKSSTPRQNPKVASKAPLLPHHHFILLFSTFFAVISLTQVIEPYTLRPFVPFVFLAVALVPKKMWSPLSRLILFALLVGGVLLQAGGFTDEVGTSFLAATMMVKFVEMKTVRDASMMALFNTIAPFTAFLQDQTPFILLCGFLGVVFTLALSQSLHNYSFGSRKKVLTTNLILVMKSFLLVLPFAVVLYTISPRLDNPLWEAYTKSRQTGGLSDEMDASSWGEVYQNLSTAFRLRFEGKAPPLNELYLRGAVLWSFDGKTWTSKPSVPEAVERVTQTRATPQAQNTYTYTTTYNMNSKYVYALDYPTFIPENVFRNSDDSLVSGRYRIRNQSIKWNSGKGVFSPLTDAERVSALQLPNQGNEKARLWAQSQRAKFSTDQEYAIFVRDYLKSDFTYTLAPPQRGNDTVDDFFFITKQGYCVHFSSTFTYLMRAAGVPARVVTGYVALEISEMGDFYRVRQADAHAWSEIWVDNAWVRMDPTPSVGAPPSERDAIWRFWDRSYETMDWAKDAWQRYVLYYDADAQRQTIGKIKNTMSLANVERFFKNLNLPQIIGGVLGLGFILAMMAYIHYRMMLRRLSYNLVSKFDHLLNKYQTFDASLPWVSRVEQIQKAPEQELVLLKEIAHQMNDYVFNPHSKIDGLGLLKKIRLVSNLRKRRI